MQKPNLILETDSYKLTHAKMYPAGTERVYSYFESRNGAKWPETVFFGLYPLLNDLIDNFPDKHDLDEARVLSGFHFGNTHIFNDKGWQDLIELGHFPVKIKAVREGTPVPTGNVLMTVVNTDDRFWWLTNALESYLTHVWYPSTVATCSREVKRLIKEVLDQTSENFNALPFMLHDFGYRGATTPEAAGIGGAGHLLNFMGTDTLSAMRLAKTYYGANYSDLAFSVPASEHSVMTALGEDGEIQVVRNLIEEYPTGILSVVADSYDIYRFVKDYLVTLRSSISEREGVFVVRPDSITSQHTTPAALTLWIIESLASTFGNDANAKGYKVLNPKVRILWGDGIDIDGIRDILYTLKAHGWAADNTVFGMGGGLLQKHNRDTQRFAFKSSAQRRGGQWFDIYKKPLDLSKASKKGRLALALDNGVYRTIENLNYEFGPDRLITVYEDGKISNIPNWNEMRDRAAL